MSPPLVVAFALAGRVHINLSREPLGKDRDGKEVYLRDLWPSLSEIRDAMQTALTPKLSATLSRFCGSKSEVERHSFEHRRYLRMGPEEHIIQEPPFFQGFTLEPTQIEENLRLARLAFSATQ